MEAREILCGRRAEEGAVFGGLLRRVQGGTLSGKAVNAYSGSYKAESGGKLSIGKLGGTLMAGPPELQAVESAYFAALAKVASYTVDGSTLTLHDAGGAEILEFSKSDIGLVGAWTVTAYNDGKQAVVSVLSKTTITLSFAANGRVSGDAGINRYDAAYTTDGADGLEIGPIATTRKAGTAEAMEQEARVPRGAVGGEGLPVERPNARAARPRGRASGERAARGRNAQAVASQRRPRVAPVTWPALVARRSPARACR